MDINQSLQEFGLTEKESIIYSTLLQLGCGSILDVSKSSSLKRPTIYSGIESLESKGLVHRKPIGKRTTYIAESPEALQTLLKRREKQLSSLIPQLEAITNVPRGTKPEIRYFEGRDAVRNLYKSVFANLDAGGSIDFITSIRDLMMVFPDLLHEFNAYAIKWKISMRELVPKNKSTLDYLNSTEWLHFGNNRHTVRFLPHGYDLFDSEIVILKDQILIVSFRPEIFGISIRSQHVVETFKTIFKFSWTLSENA